MNKYEVNKSLDVFEEKMNVITKTLVCEYIAYAGEVGMEFKCDDGRSILAYHPLAKEWRKIAVALPTDNFSLKITQLDPLKIACNFQ